METTKKLIRTDRNGTKYWNVIDVCQRCGGRGDYILGTLNYGVCFLCGGSGKREYSLKEYTPEHEAKLSARREAKAAKQAEAKAKYEEEHAEEIAEERRKIFIRLNHSKKSNSCELLKILRQLAIPSPPRPIRNPIPFRLTAIQILPV